MPAKKGTNSKAEAGRARKAEQAAQKAEKASKEREAQESKEWQKGADLRGQARADAAAAKADEAARKRKEKAELLAAEEATQDNVKPKKAPALSKKKGKKKNDLSLLEDALVGEAEKKAKAKKRAELLKKEKEMEAKKEAAAAAVAAGTGTSALGGQAVDPLMQNTDAMLSGAVGREANKQAMESASGLDAALDSLDVKVGSDVKRRKALFLAFEERMLPIVKEEHPGLRLTQYKEKVFNLWKKSPENPANQPGP